MNPLVAIEHTLLKADATPHAIEALCDEALQFGFAGVCVNPAYVPLARARLVERSRVVSVVGFPLGASSEAADVCETKWLVSHGVDEIDMVVPVGLALAGRLDQVTARVRAVREAASGVVLKVILETGYFDSEPLRRLAAAALEAAPDYLKTSSGYGPRGATVEDVELLVSVGDGHTRVKASGGIRTLDAARALLAAGASRLGTSSGASMARELETERQSAEGR